MIFLKQCVIFQTREFSMPLLWSRLQGRDYFVLCTALHGHYAGIFVLNERVPNLDIKGLRPPQFIPSVKARMTHIALFKQIMLTATNKCSTSSQRLTQSQSHYFKFSCSIAKSSLSLESDYKSSKAFISFGNVFKFKLRERHFLKLVLLQRLCCEAVCCPRSVLILFICIVCWGDVFNFR